MKKILLLGGSRYLLPVIKSAHELGLYVITCDYLPDNIAHKYSDEYVNVSIIDKEAVLEAAKKLEIDGIMSFATDPGVVTAAYVAEKLSLPSVGSYAAVSILQNKGKFRKFLTENGFNVPLAKSYKNIGLALEDKNLFKLPIIIKPTDSAGSKGVKKVESFDQMKSAIEYALSYSHNDEFIVEEFIEKKAFSSDSDSFSVNGELKFISFSSQRFDVNAVNPYTPSAYSWPSSISKENQNVLFNELQRLIKLLGLGTSIYNIEVRESMEGIPYIMEVSPRGGGNRLAEMLRYATGVDLIKGAVKAAVGENVDHIEQKDFNGHWAEAILHSDKSGIFAGLEISAEINGNVVEKDLWLEEGTFVGGFEGANEAIGTLVLKFEDSSQLARVMNNLDDYIKINVI